MKKEPFFGRNREMKILQRLLRKRFASLVVIKGRRRIGKSRLAAEFGKALKKFTFTGLAPDKKITAQMQRQDFVTQMQQQLSMPGLASDDWSNIFWSLAEKTRRGRILIILDEINWMGNKDVTFLEKLKSAWDTHFKNNPELIMILSGSMSAWIEKNILSSTGFMGRISTDMTLAELPLNVCNEFWRYRGEHVSAYEKFKILSVTGGIPKYLEEVYPELPANDNIQALCFEKESYLFKEFDKIFTDLFATRAKTFQKIIERLAEGSANQAEISTALGVEKGGMVSDYLDELVVTGFVDRDFTWSVATGKLSKLSQYRLKDNYLRFYLKVIKKYKHKILQDDLDHPPNWDGIMGLQFENLVLNNRKIIKNCLGLKSSDIIVDNPYFQNKTQKHPGCQIDYMIQTRYNSLHLCEIKFSKNKIGMSVTEQINKKIQALTLGKQYSIWPVLIHVNGVTDELEHSGFFSKIIDFSSMLDS